MLQKSYSDNLNKKPIRSIDRIDPSSQPIIGAFVQLYHFIIGAGALPLRLLLRDNIGERSISSFSLVISITLHLVYVIKYVAIFSSASLFTALIFTDNDDTILGTSSVILLLAAYLSNFFTYYLIYVFIFQAKKHFINVVERAKSKEMTHASDYRGDGKYFRHHIGRIFRTPIGSFEVDETIMRMLVEPWQMMFFGFRLLITSVLLVIPFFFGWLGNLQFLPVIFLSIGATGIVIMVSAICLFLEELGIYLRIRGAVLDTIDGEMDLELISKKRERVVAKSESSIQGAISSKHYPLVKLGAK